MVSSADVIAILMKDYDAENAPSLSPFITAASVIVTEAATRATAAGIPMTTARRNAIEGWLAAHFYACSDRPYDRRTIDRDSYVLSGETGKGLESTLYGQTAMALDTSSYLSSVGGGASSSGGEIQVSGPGGSEILVSGSTLGAPEIDASAANLSILADTVVITGRNFDSIAANNTWDLGLGAVGHTTAASATQITITFETKPQTTGNLMAVITNSNGTSDEAQIATVV